MIQRRDGDSNASVSSIFQPFSLPALSIFVRYPLSSLQRRTRSTEVEKERATSEESSFAFGLCLARLVDSGCFATRIANAAASLRDCRTCRQPVLDSTSRCSSYVESWTMLFSLLVSLSCDARNKGEKKNETKESAVFV